MLSWLRVAARLCGLAIGCALWAGAASADAVLSSAGSSAPLSAKLSAMFGAERAALAALPPDGLAPPAPRKRRGGGGAETETVRYDAVWLAGLPAASGGPDWECLTKALYFEARGETVEGQFAVAEVVLNRVDSPGYPASVCDVVHQGGPGGCQFSFTCDGKPDRIGEREAWLEAGKIAALMLSGAPRALTRGATHFHTTAVRPGWASKFARTAAIGQHLFYRQPTLGAP